MCLKPSVLNSSMAQGAFGLFMVGRNYTLLCSLVPLCIRFNFYFPHWHICHSCSPVFFSRVSHGLVLCIAFFYHIPTHVSGPGLSSSTEWLEGITHFGSFQACIIWEYFYQVFLISTVHVISTLERCKDINNRTGIFCSKMWHVQACDTHLIYLRRKKANQGFFLWNLICTILINFHTRLLSIGSIIICLKMKGLIPTEGASGYIMSNSWTKIQEVVF